MPFWVAAHIICSAMDLASNRASTEGESPLPCWYLTIASAREVMVADVANMISFLQHVGG